MNSISYLANRVDDALRSPKGTIQIIPKDPLTKNDQPIQIDPSQKPSLSPSHGNNDQQNSKEDDSSMPYIIRLILFIPNLLILRPFLFCWFIITFPLNVVEQRRNKNKVHEADLESNLDTNNQDFKNSKSSTSFNALLSNTTIMEMDEEVEKSEADTNTNTNIDLKSPTSPSSLVTSGGSRQFTFPKTVFPASVINSNVKKTLILDLDETLVHSLSRGTRMSNGHMVEVKLRDQVATLYSVHKRPYCDLFLKQVSKWYNLVIFTASVKEYADPVIDLLETERKYFNQRFYRNHCTLREGQGYIKDLTAVDKNLNNLIIIDNSPISYALHENNAIVVEGWINDPSDNDLLNLIPLLNSLRFTTDVRPILSLKNGEVAFER